MTAAFESDRARGSYGVQHAAEKVVSAILDDMNVNDAGVLMRFRRHGDPRYEKMRNLSVGDKIEFNADSFQIPYDVDFEGSKRIRGVVTRVDDKFWHIRVRSPASISGKRLKVPRSYVA